MSTANLKAILLVVLTFGLLATLGYLVHTKADPVIVGTISVALGAGIPMVFRAFSGNGDAVKKDPPTGPLAVVLVAGSILMGTADCGMTLPTPKQQGAIVDGSCEMLDAFVGSPLEQAICASAEDIVAIEADVRTQRVDAGPGKLGRKSGQCKIVRTVCATEDELASAIKARKATR